MATDDPTTAFTEGIEYLDQHWDDHQIFLKIGTCMCGRPAHIIKSRLPSQLDTHCAGTGDAPHQPCTFRTITLVPTLNNLGGSRHKLLKQELHPFLQLYRNMIGQGASFQQGDTLRIVLANAPQPRRRAAPSRNTRAHIIASTTTSTAFGWRFSIGKVNVGTALRKAAAGLMAAFQARQMGIAFRQAYADGDWNAVLSLIVPMAQVPDGGPNKPLAEANNRMRQALEQDAARQSVKSLHNSTDRLQRTQRDLERGSVRDLQELEAASRLRQEGCAGNAAQAAVSAHVESRDRPHGLKTRRAKAEEQPTRKSLWSRLWPSKSGAGGGQTNAGSTPTKVRKD